MNDDMAKPPSHDSSRSVATSWDDRQKLDATFWMVEEARTPEAFVQSGERDFASLTDGLDDSRLRTVTALDLGCGTGRVARAASRGVYRLTGVDVSVEALSEARRFCSACTNVSFVPCNGLDLSNLSGPFDFIYSFAALPHLTPHVFCRYLLDIRRLMHSGSRARLQVYAGAEVLFAKQDTFSLRSYEKERLIKACALAGMAVASLQPVPLPFEPSDPERNRTPVILDCKPTGVPAASVGPVIEALVSAEEPAGDGGGSYDEYRYLLTKANELLRQQDLAGAERFLSFAIGTYPLADDNTKSALQRIRAAMAEWP